MMTDLRIEASGKGEASLLDSIIRAYRYHDFRRYSSVNGKASVKYLHGVIMERLSLDDAESWSAYYGDAPVGFTAVSPLDWDSNYFGLRMAQLTVIISAEQPAQVFSVADKLVHTALKAASHKGFQHLSLRVDVEDIGLVHALEKRGFRLMDTLVAYTFQMGRNHLPEIRPKYDLRLYQPEDFESVLNIADVSFKGYPNRFTLDSYIPEKRAQAFYREWTKNSCNGQFSDEMLVAERKGRVVGFLSYKVNRALKRFTGIQIITGGLSGCYPVRFNAFLDLLREATQRNLTTVDAIEAESHLFNIATPIYYQQLNYRYARARHSFHLWLKD